MKKGILYTVINFLLEFLKWLSLVEYFKLIAKKIYKSDPIAASRIGVDLFIFTKWTVVILLWITQTNGEKINYLIWYLIITNLYTYFFYHAWTNDLSIANFDLDRVKRRFLNLMLAISFNTTCFAYLFAQSFSTNFKWLDGVGSAKSSIFYSIANSLTVSYDRVKATTEIGNILSITETITTFIFLTIILSNSIPQPKDD